MDGSISYYVMITVGKGKNISSGACATIGDAKYERALLRAKAMKIKAKKIRDEYKSGKRKA